MRLADIAIKIGSGATPKGGEDSYLRIRSRYALVRSQNVFDRHFNTAGLAFISDQQAEGLRSVRLQAGDLLLNITGDGVTFSRVCAVPERILPACVNQHVAIIRLDRSLADPGYVLSFLTHKTVKHYIESFNAGGSRRAITKGHIESFRLALPPLSVQRAIAHILGTLDDKIELNRRINETLEAMARALFKSWFIDFDPVRAKVEGRDPGLPEQLADLFPDDFVDSKQGEIPAGWCVGNLSDFATLNPESWSKGAKPLGIEYVDLSNTKWGRIEQTQNYVWEARPSRAQRILRPGDTIVGTVRPGNGSYALIGQAGLTGSTGFAVLRAPRPEQVEWTYLAATSVESIERLAQLADGAAYPAVRPEVVMATPVVYPAGSAVLRRFSGTAKPLMEKIGSNEMESRILAALRDTLLPKLISGQLRLNDAERFTRDAAS